MQSTLLRIANDHVRSAPKKGNCCMWRQPFIALMSLLIVGCQSQSQTRKYWTKSNTTLAQTIKDCQKCKETARGKATEGHYNRYRNSVTSGGSIPFGGELEESERYFDKVHYFRSCMRSLGYQQIPEHRIGSEMRKANRFGAGDIQHLAGE